MIDNVRLIGLGDGDDRMLATDFDKSGLAVQMPAAQTDRKAVHDAIIAGFVADLGL